MCLSSGTRSRSDRLHRQLCHRGGGGRGEAAQEPGARQPQLPVHGLHRPAADLQRGAASARVHSVHTAQQSPGESSSLLSHLDVTLLDVTLRNWTYRIRFLATSCFLCVLSVLINTSAPSYTVQWLTVHTTLITCLQKSLWLLCLNSNCAAVIQMCSFKVLCVLKQKNICYLKKGKKKRSASLAFM